MKIFKLSLICLILAGAISCKKPTLATLNISVDDAAGMLAGSIASPTYGVNSISADVSLNAQTSTANTNQACGSTMLDTIIRQNTAGTPASYYYKLIYSNKLTCNVSNSPDNIASSLSYTGNYSNPQLTLTNSGTVTFTIAGFTQTATTYSVNGEYKSSGSFKLKADTTNAGTASFDIVVKNLVVSKSTQVINSGTATVIVTGTTLKKGDFTYNGTLTFNGSSMATLVINGTTYTVNLTTGVVTRK